jgi:hypothetical protein
VNTAPEELVIVVPFRDRLSHLHIFIPHLIRFLGDRRLPFRIVVVNQGDSFPFNRGKLLNVGFQLGCENAGWVCFHDVDLLPDDDSCDYSRPDRPTHLAGCAEQYAFKLPYSSYCGGIILFSSVDFRGINGFSNHYWGWGREDDDVYLRLLQKHAQIGRRSGRYRSLSHAPSSRQYYSINSERLVRTAVTVPNQTLVAPCNAQGIADLHLLDMPNNSTPLEMECDGLSTLEYRLLLRKPLNTIFPANIEVPDHHELISVGLCYESKARDFPRGSLAGASAQ